LAHGHRRCTVVPADGVMHVGQTAPSCRGLNISAVCSVFGVSVVSIEQCSRARACTRSWIMVLDQLQEVLERTLCSTDKLYP
jgi:hypothetical protein